MGSCEKNKLKYETKQRKIRREIAEFVLQNTVCVQSTCWAVSECVCRLSAELPDQDFGIYKTSMVPCRQRGGEGGRSAHSDPDSRDPN